MGVDFEPQRPLRAKTRDDVFRAGPVVGGECRSGDNNLFWSLEPPNSRIELTSLTSLECITKIL